MKLFGFQIGKGETAQAYVLPTHVAALFGATEGKEMIVDATVEGIEAIQAAESFMVNANAQLSAHESLQTEVTELKAAKATLEASEIALKEANAQLTTKNAELGAMPATNHTSANAQQDAAQGGVEKELLGFEKLEQQARAEAIAFDEKFPLTQNNK